MIDSKGNAIYAEGLTRRFGDFTAVDGIDLAIKRGTVFGFLGPNGAGKSTTIRMLAGLLKPSAGSGVVNGFDVLSEPEEIKRHIGYMSQSFSLYGDLTVEENIDFYSGIYTIPAAKRKERKEYALELSGLAERRGQMTRDLPRGHKQRLALSTAILHEPPILFLDEPTSGVDPVSRRFFWDLIYGLAQSGTTVLVTTHYMDEADYCDRLCLIYRGRIIAEDTPTGLRTNAIKQSVLEIETDNPFEALELLSARGIKAAVFGSMLHVSTEIEQETIATVRSVLGEAGIAMKRAEAIVTSLEDVFVALIEASQ